MVNYLLLAISISLAVIGQLLMKKGMQIFGVFPAKEILIRFFPIVFSPLVFLGLFAFAVSSVFWLIVLSRLDLSLVYPMVSIGYIAVALFSVFYLGESVSLLRWAGIFVICIGVFLISRS